MARKSIGTLVVLLLAPILLVNVGAQSNCPMALTSLSPCLTFSTGNSSTPSPSCCSELANLVQTAPSCICEALNIGGAQAVGFVLSRFLPSSLPGACNLKIPTDQCNGLGSASNPNNNTQGSEDAYSNATTSNMSSLLSIFLTLFASYALLWIPSS